MRLLLNKLKPAAGFGTILHVLLLVVLPLSVFVFVRLGFTQLALSVVVLAKWRMFAVRPRFWAANVRSGAVDLMVGLSIALFMSHTTSVSMQLIWATMYAVWLIYIKPGNSIVTVSAQAFIGQFFALTAIYLIWPLAPVYLLTFVTGLTCYLAARHFFDSFDEPHARMLSYYWGYFGAVLAWILSHWLLYYRTMAQPTLFLSALGYGLAALYYLDHYDRLHKSVRRQFLFIVIAIILVVLAFSDWGDKVV